jgi:HK97 family phage major capsid protein
MTNLDRLVNERCQIARMKAGKACSEARAHSGSAQRQAAAEVALSDYKHYLDLRDRIEAESSGTYNERGPSFFQDVIQGGQGHNRSADERLSEQRAFGALMVPEYLSAQIRNSGHSQRPLADHLAALSGPLPAQGGQVVMTRVTTGQTAEMQSTDGAAITPDNPATTEVTANVVTVASNAQLSMQIVERSDRAGFDQLVAGEILGACDALQESQIINGSGTSGEALGLLNTPSIGTMTLTATSSTALLDAISRTSAASHQAAGYAPDLVVMAPRRWRWLLANSGTAGAALQVDTGTGPISGRVLGMNVIASPSVPLTLTSNQDAIIVCRSSDVMMQETPAQIRYIKDTSGQAQSLLQQVQVSRYFAVGALRPAGVYAITGTGLANPY